MSNPLASYFTNSNDLDDTNGTDLGGRSFFDVISECKDFNKETDTTNITNEDHTYDIWPTPENLISQNHVTDTKFNFAFNEPLGDPLKNIVNKFYGEKESEKRILPNAESVIADVNGIQILIKCGCIRSVINLTTKILKDIDPTYSPYSLQIWYLRIACLMKLKLFKEAEYELVQFQEFNKKQYFYEFHSEQYPCRKGSMIPFGLRMLNAELPHYLGRSDDSIQNLYKILSIVQNVLKNLEHDNDESCKIWYVRKTKVLFSIINILIGRKSYEKAIEMLSQVLETQYVDKCAIWSCIGKLFVQMGALMDASDSFLKAKDFSNQKSIEDNARILINLSLIRIANGMYNEAYDSLIEANNIIPNNPTITNNMAFCLFYSGNLKQAITLIENFIRNNPNNNVNESIIFNLCTLYELESAKAHQKKLNLLLWLNVYAGDGFYEACLQL